MSFARTSASWLLGAVLMTSSFAFAKDKDGEGKSAREDDQKKVELKKGADLAERVERLEREVRELTAMLKQYPKGMPEKPVAKHQGDRKSTGKETPAGPAKKEHPVAKGKPPAKEKGAAEHAKPGQVQLVKGQDGKLLVPLSALPPGIQQGFINQSKAEAGKAKPKGDDDDDKGGKKKEKDDDDDDDKGKPKK